jgi:hypothetical protein
LSTDTLDLAWRGGRNSGEERRHERPEVLHAIGCGAHDDNAEWEHRDGLLELQAAVHRAQGIVVATHAVEEIAVLDASPATADHRVNIMAAEFRGEVYR